MRRTRCRLVETPTRWDYARAEDYDGIDGAMPHRPLPAFVFRRVESGGRRHDAGVWPLLRAQDQAFRGGCLTARIIPAWSCTASSAIW